MLFNLVAWTEEKEPTTQLVLYVYLLVVDCEHVNLRSDFGRSEQLKVNATSLVSTDSSLILRVLTEIEASWF